MKKQSKKTQKSKKESLAYPNNPVSVTKVQNRGPRKWKEITYKQFQENLHTEGHESPAPQIKKMSNKKQVSYQSLAQYKLK